jgi:DnaJ-class molecular chaperone
MKKIVCPTCTGVGMIGIFPCPECGGDGYVEVEDDEYDEEKDELYEG